MTHDKDVRRMSYVITIPREEIKDIFIQAHNAKGEKSEDELASMILADKILHLIGAEREG